MKHITANILLATGLSIATTTAMATCEYGETGYVYVTASCVQVPRSNPEGPCEYGEDDDPGATYFLSNVIYDDGDDDTYPTSQFFDEIEIQHGVTESGHASYCYESKAEAKASRREWRADLRRRDSDTEILKVHLESY